MKRTSKRSRLPPSPERETVHEGAAYVRGYSATLVNIDGKEYSFEEIRAARVGYVDPTCSLDHRDVEAIKAREHARRKWKEAEMQKQAARLAEERRIVEEQRRLVDEERRKLEEDARREEQRRSAEEAKRARLTRPRDDDHLHHHHQQQQPPTATSHSHSGSARGTTSSTAGSHMRGRDDDEGASRLKKRVRLSDDEEQPFSASKPAPRSPTMTIHTKKALETVLPLFGDDGEAAMRDETASLTAALRGGTMEARGGDPPTPTVTMNTRAAMANVLSMFSGGFDDETRMLNGDLTLSSIPVEERENALGRNRGGRAASKSSVASAGSAPRKALGLAVQKPKKTNREILEEELAKENRQAAANTGASPERVTRGVKRTLGDAVREVIAGRVAEEASPAGELTGSLSWDDTGLLPGALAPTAPSLGIRVYEDPSDRASSMKQAARTSKLDLSVYEDEALGNDTSTLPVPVLQKPQAASFAIYSDFDDNASDKPQRGSKESSVYQSRQDNGRKKPAIVDPWLMSEEKRLLDLLKDKIASYPNFFDCRQDKAPGKHLLKGTAVPLAVLAIFPKGRRVSSVSDPQLELPEVCFEIEERVGEGAFATVFKVDVVACSYMDLESGETIAALKVLNEPSLWEWYIYHQICDRVPKQLHHNFVRFYSIHMYSDKALTLMQFSDGTLQDATNCYHSLNKRMDETLIIYYTLEMLKIIETLHGVGIIHGDIKPDNFLIKNNPNQELADWGSGSQGGWDSRGLVLIDYSRSIDMRLYPEGTVFKSGNHVEGFKCTEMTEGRPWTYQADLYGICGVVHYLLHGSLLETVKDPKTKELMPKQPFKRYHKADLWRPLFREFLNVKDCDSIPDITHHRRRFEDHLKKDPAQAKALKTLLARQNILMFERNKKK